MKILNLIILLSLSTYNYGQNNILITEVNEIKYSINGDNYTKIRTSLINNTKVDYVFWLSKKKHTSNLIERKIKDYFFSRKGDFSFAEIIYDNVVLKTPNSLYFDFVKKLRPSEIFYFDILIKDSINEYNLHKINMFFHQEVISVPESSLNDYFNPYIIEGYYFKENSICFLYESIFINN